MQRLIQMGWVVSLLAIWACGGHQAQRAGSAQNIRNASAGRAHVEGAQVDGAAGNRPSEGAVRGQGNVQGALGSGEGRPEGVAAESGEPAVQEYPAPTGIVANAVAMVRNGQYEAAISECKSALRRSEKYTPAMEVMGRAYYQLGKTEFANSICDIALSIDANSGSCYNLKGFIALKNNDLARALDNFKKATEVQPDFGPGLMNLGAQYLRVKNYNEAIVVLERAAETLKNRAEVFLNLGAAYRGANEVIKAQQAFTKALRLRPNYGAAYYNLGVLYLDAPEFPGASRLQQLTTAVAHFTQYKQIEGFRNEQDPVHRYLESAQKEIQREERRIERQQEQEARDAMQKAEREEAAKASAKDADKGNEAAKAPTSEGQEAPAPTPNNDQAKEQNTPAEPQGDEQQK